jgi:hypothetical protein
MTPAKKKARGRIATGNGKLSASEKVIATRRKRNVGVSLVQSWSEAGRDHQRHAQRQQQPMTPMTTMMKMKKRQEREPPCFLRQR